MKFRLIEQRTNKFDLDEALGLKEGISKNMSAEDIAKKHGVSVSKIKAQLAKGIKVEKEHTKDEKKAERIALDHLFEIPNYYDKLAKMEKSALKESNKTLKESLVKYAGFYIDKEGDDVDVSPMTEWDDMYPPKEDKLAIRKLVKNTKFYGMTIAQAKKKIDSIISNYWEEKRKTTKESLKEDTIKQNGKWVNKGKEGTHGTFRTKKAADAQRKAMFSNSEKNRNFGESLLKEDTDINHYRDMIKRLDRAERSLLQARNEIFDILEINDNSTGTFNTALEVLKDDIHKGYDKLFDSHFANPDEYSKQFKEEKIDEALYNDEVQEFFNKARKLGARTYEDLIKILLNDPASVGNKDIEKLRNYYKVANPDDKTLSNDVVTESFNQKSLKTAIEKKIREHFKDWEDEEYDELIKDYLYIDIVPTEDGRTKVEVRCELSYDTLDEIADELNPIIQKLDKDAYFDHEDAGIINAFLNQKIEENPNESQMQEIAQAYRDLSKEYGVDIKELVYGVDGFMQERYPNGFPDFKGDIIFSEEYWEEFEDWCKERGIKLEKLTNEKLIQGKSEETVRKNTETEIKAGKDPKQAYAIAKSIQRKNMKEDLDDDTFTIEEEIWVKDAEGNIIDKLNEKDDFLFFHQFDNQEIIDELLDRHGEEITITRIHFNDDNLPEEYETIYDFNEADKPELDVSNMDDDISADDMHRISAMAIEESKKLKKISAEKQNDMTVEDYSEMTPEQDEIVDYVSPNAVDANMRPVEVDLNKI